MTVFSDSSVLVSAYSPDGNSVRAAGAIEKFSGLVSISALVRLEVVNALHLRIFRKEANHEMVEKAIAAFKRDLETHLLLVFPVPLAAWTLAERLSTSHSVQLGARSLDILQVATAVALRAEIFLTFDRRQAELARLQGLTTPLQVIPQ